MNRSRSRPRGRTRNRHPVGSRAAAVGFLLCAVVLLALLTDRRGPPLLFPAAVIIVLPLGLFVHRLWKTHREQREGDAEWRRDEVDARGRRSLTDVGVDGMTGTEFESFVADLCRRDGCTGVRRVGGARDNGVDILGRLSDGRSLVVQCKRYSPKRSIPAATVRELIGALVHAGADVAVLVTTTRVTAPALETARANGVPVVHRDLLGHWCAGATLPAVLALDGAGQGPPRRRGRG
ncbi:restriction endonuclease [Streptomyces sp. ST2-7A]|uniref:restriction endonuclease n=1 Tax=Streptomyces sp. ST2-7A TaxID=2907214 RepID=UPI001F375CCF|nr:restriction endonuclease [Streptomyces sp. ST2-7A]MCE7079866.1 restriction endonuclease [Streptomyces sp. ST2-7A]